MRIAWLTDIHLGWLNQNARKNFFEEISRAQPEAVLIGGDICNHDFLEPWLAKLHKMVRVPVYFCLGNHDFYHSSIYQVRELARTITETHEQISWLPSIGVVPLPQDVGLVGHGCWGDGRAGSFFKSPLSLNDFKFIQELTGLSKHEQLEQVRRLGTEAADYLASQSEIAAQRFGNVLVLTHVPPFPEACLYMGKPSEEGLPFFCCKSAGDVLKAVATSNPETQFLVLSGHTHDAADVQITDNLRCIVAGAEYGRPAFRVLELPDIFSALNCDKHVREELAESVERGWSELKTGQCEVVKDDDTFFEDLRKKLRQRGDGEDIEPDLGG